MGEFQLHGKTVVNDMLAGDLGIQVEIYLPEILVNNVGYNVGEVEDEQQQHK